jgi:SAM-dependent methyltransferase
MTSVNVPNIGVVNFPDEMSIDDINKAIRDEVIPQFARQNAAPAAPAAAPTAESVGRGFFQRNLLDIGERGYQQTRIGVAAARGRSPDSFYGLSPEDAASEIVQRRERLQQIPQTEEVQRVGRAAEESGSVLGAVGQYARSPEAIVNIAGESIGANPVAGGLGVVGAALPVPFLRQIVGALAGALNFPTEYASSLGQSLLEAARDQGIDPTNREQLAGLIRAINADPALFEKTRNDALTRAGIISATDAVAGGLAGRMSGRGFAGRVGGGAAAEAAGGGLGEAGAQLATEGQISPAEVGAEIVGGGVGGGLGNVVRAGPPPAGPRSREEDEALRAAIDAATGERDYLDGTSNQPASAPAPAASAEPSPQGILPEVDGQQQTAPIFPPTDQAYSFNIPEGTEFPVRTPDGSMSVSVVPQIVDLGSLIPASGDLQNRNTSNKANQATIASIANAPDFFYLGTSQYADRGAPIVGPDNMVEVGNHRVMGLKRAAEENPEGFANYVKSLQNAGYDTKGMALPVLIRRRVTGIDDNQRVEFVRLANKEANQSFNALETAKEDASKITPEMIAQFDGEITGGIRAAKNLPFVRKFLSEILTKNEFNKASTDEAGISDALEVRIKNALFAHAYNNPQLLAKVVERGDDDSKTITNGLIGATGAMQELRRGIETGRIRPEFDIVDAIVAASDRLRAAKANGIEMSRVLDTEDMMNPLSNLDKAATLLLLNDNKDKIASASAITKRLKAYAEDAKTQTPDEDLVGGERRITAEEALTKALTPGQTSMFSARNVPTEEDVDAEAESGERKTPPEVERALALIKARLDSLRAKGKQGTALAKALEDALANRKLNATQIYAAFTVDEALLKTMPKGANYEFQFLHDLAVTDKDAAEKAGVKLGTKLQGMKVSPAKEGLPGLIQLSLADDMLPLLKETAFHEAFHVLQDYFSAYDKGFKAAVGKHFKDGMKLADFEPSIKRRLQAMKSPDSEQSYWDSLVEGLGEGEIKHGYEAQAYAFGALADAAMRGEKVVGLLPPFQRFFNFLRDTMSALRSGFTGDGFRTPASLLSGAVDRAARYDQQAPATGGEAYSSRNVQGDLFTPTAQSNVKAANNKYLENISNIRKAQVVYKDDEVALLNAYDLIQFPGGSGQQEAQYYVGVNLDKKRTSGFVDIENYKGNDFSPEQINFLIKKKEEHLEKQVRIALANPRGPFKGQSNIAFDSSFPKDSRGFAEGLVKELGLDDVPIFFTDLKGAGDPGFASRNSLYGWPYDNFRYFSTRSDDSVYGLAYNVGDVAAIAINSSKRQSAQIEAIAHEIGHIFDHKVLQKASPQEKQAIRNAFNQWMGKKGSLPAHEYIAALRTATVGKYISNKAKAANPNFNAKNLNNYLRSFDEWFADQVAKWGTTSAPAQTLLARFFRRIAMAYKKIVSALGGDGLPDQTVANFIENHRKMRNTVSIFSAPPIPGPGAKKPAQTTFQFLSEVNSLNQEITSADTSVNQVAATFKKVDFEPGTKNLDYGGGKYDAGTDYMKSIGVENLVYDPFNRTEEHNKDVISKLAKEKASTVTVNNVLNVIAESDARDFVVKDAARYLKPDGTAYFLVYEGDRSGEGKRTSKGFQNNKKAEFYLPAVKEHFSEVSRQGNMIVAREPKASGEARFSSRKTPSKPTAPTKGAGSVAGNARAFYNTAVSQTNKPNPFDAALGYMFDKKPGETISGAIARTSVNAAAPLHNLNAMASKNGYTGLSAGQALELQMSNSGRINQLLNAGMGKLNAKTGEITLRKDVKPLLEIMKDADIGNDTVKKGWLQSYLIALRERDLRKANRQVFTNASDQEVADTIKYVEINYPKFKQTAADLDKMNKALIEFALEAGLITPKHAQTLSSRFYSPAYREDVDRINNALNVQLTGSDKSLNDLYSNIILNADSIMKASLKNVAMRTAAETMQFAGVGRVNTSGKKSDNTITYSVGGKEVNFDVDDPVLYSALTSMPRETIRGIYQAMAGAASFFRDFITAAPSFILSNLYKGKFTAYVQEGAPLLTNTLGGVKDALRNTTTLQNFQMQTGFGGMEWGMKPKDMVKTFENKLTDKGMMQAISRGNVFSALRQGFNGLQALSEASEMAERIKLSEGLIKKGMSPRDAYFQAYLLAPYSRKGTGGGWLGQSVQFMAPLIPFLNAKLQTTYRLLENEKGSKRILGLPKEIFLRGLVVTAFSTAVYALNMADDEEEWDALPNYMKLNYDIIPFTNGLVTLPRAFEIGQIFGALPVFVLDAIRRGEGRDLTEALLQVAVSTVWMNPIPKGIEPLIGAVTNYDFFRRQPLESAGEQGLPIEERVKRSTTSIAKGVSSAFNSVFNDSLSPIQAQAILEGYSGTIGTMIMAGFDSILAATGAIPGKPAGAFGDPLGMPAILASSVGADRFYRDRESMTSRFVADFYRIKETTDQLVRSQTRATDARDYERLQELRGEEGLPLRMRPAVNAASTQISELNARIRLIERGDLDAVSKTEAIQPLIDRRDRIAKRVVDQARNLGVF